MTSNVVAPYLSYAMGRHDPAVDRHLSGTMTSGFVVCLLMPRVPFNSSAVHRGLFAEELLNAQRVTVDGFPAASMLGRIEDAKGSKCGEP